MDELRKKGEILDLIYNIKHSKYVRKQTINGVNRQMQIRKNIFNIHGA